MGLPADFMKRRTDEELREALLRQLAWAGRANIEVGIAGRRGHTRRFCSGLFIEDRRRGDREVPR